MPLFFTEDNIKLQQKQIQIPDDVSKKLRQNMNMFSKFKTVNGFKRLRALTDSEYNKRSDGKDRQHNNKLNVSFGDAKRIVYDMEHMPQSEKNIEFTMIGGFDTLNALKTGINQARSSVKAVEPVREVPKLEKDKPKVEAPDNEIKVNKVQVHLESKQINEDIGDDGLDFESFVVNYDESYVFNEFLNSDSEKQDWGVLIDPMQYKKALSEFTQYGKLIRFPANRVYSWIGIIMKNTCILRANTVIAGHSRYFPQDDFQDFVHSYFGPNRNVQIDGFTVKIEITYDETIAICNHENPLIKEAVDKYGQTYLPWVTQSDADRLANQADIARMGEKFGELSEYISAYNKTPKNRNKQIEIDYKTAKIYWNIQDYELLGDIGFYDWMQMPDGSDAYSDYGLEPLEKILYQFNDNTTPEECLVLVNRALDVSHCRGDMASIFITGGSKSLTSISEEIKKCKGKEIIISEKQLLSLKKII